MPPKIRPVDHDDRLTVVEHLTELRQRIFVSLAAFIPALVFCFWQNNLILEIVNEPLGRKPVALGVTEQFLTTTTLAAYAAILLAMPVVLYQAYAFVLPAFSPRERRVALPLLLLVPVLFIGGVVFSYFVILPPALKFLLSFNADEFTTLIRARDYYGFVSLTLLSMGLLFQVPVGILALSRLGLVTPEKLRKGRRYAILGMAVLAALLPTIDPLTMLLEMVPLIVLYEVSILLAAAFGRPREELTEPVPSAEST